MASSLIAELEAAIQSGSHDKRVDTLRRVTDLFLVDAKRFNEEQIGVFDDVLGHLIERIESSALTQLSSRLAAEENAPIGVLRRLAEDDQIEVASPILAQSSRLSTDDLVRIAKSKSQAHLLAISGRPTLGAQLTDALLGRGDRRVVHRLADNSGAQFSDAGFVALAKHSEMDEVLAQKVGSRSDIPDRVFRQLVLQATEAVRARLLAQASPQNREQIQRALSLAAQGIEDESDRKRREDLATAQRLVFLIPLKAADFEWATVHAILKCRAPGHVLADQDMARVKEDYRKLTKGNAQRVLRFWQVRQSVSRPSASDLSTGKTDARI